MRVTNILSAALVAGPLAVSAAGTLGFAVGNTNPDNSCKKQQDYEMDMEALKGVTKVVRTYTSGGCDTAKSIIPAAKAKGFQVVLGVWSVMTNYCSHKLGTNRHTGLIQTNPSPPTRKHFWPPSLATRPPSMPSQ
jgi:exo-beta-1,3-glucanase (GH17 family)